MLLESARGDDLPVALTALDSVWGIDPDGETVLPALREVLASPRPALRAAAAKSIAHLLVIRASRAEGPARDAILHEIVRLGDPVLPSLFEELSSPEAARGPAAREALLGVVARWPLLPRTAPRPPRSVPQALARLENPNEGARATAVLDLGRRGASELGMLPWLGRTLDDSSPVVRQATALAFALVVIDLGRAGASAAGGAR
jgi:HEAT repeat protein